jgi:nitrite reductase (NO-forming)
MIFTIAAVAVMGATLFGSTYTQTQSGSSTMSLPSTDEDLLQKIHDMGGLQLVMPQAFAETDCGVLENSGRTVHNFDLTGESIDLPILGHKADSPKTYKAMSFSQQVPGPTIRVTQGDVIKMTLTIPSGEVTGHGNDMHASQINSLNFDSINPGDPPKIFCYIAESAGVFKYHCYVWNCHC